MATTRELTRTTAPLGFVDPRLFGPRWLKEFDLAFETGWVPEMEVFEKNNVLTVRLDVPGLKKEEVTVHVAEGALTVEGERKYETEEEKNHWYRRERTYGRFSRTVALRDGVNAKEVKATFKNGVLEVTVPVRAVTTPAPHRVDVKEPEAKVTVAA
jgi:HSP20 family protein